MTIESLIIASAIVLVIGVGIFIMALEKICKEEDSAFIEDSRKAFPKSCKYCTEPSELDQHFSYVVLFGDPERTMKEVEIKYCPNCGRRLEKDG